MSRIGLEWEIERENGWAPVQAAGDAKSGRHIPTILYLAIGVALGITLAGLVMLYRLQWADGQLESELRAVVAAETAAIRIGDRDRFLELQRGDDATWLALQERTFDDYQELKRSGEVEPGRRIVEIEVSGPRGRVVLEERINDRVYHVTWFYWRYDDGWRHIPPDVIWWGDELSLEGQSVTIRYRRLDEPFAAQIAADAESWWPEGAGTIGCEPPPHLSIEVSPDPASTVGWLPDDEPTLRVHSPLLGRVPADGSLEPGFRAELADLLARRLVECVTGDLSATWPGDAYWLAARLSDWLSSQMYPGAGEGDFIASLVSEFGADFPARLAESLRPESDIGLLSSLSGVPLSDLPVEWASFFQYRLDAEAYRIAQGNQNAHLSLIDASHPPGPVPGDNPTVVGVEFSRDVAWVAIDVDRDGARWQDWVAFRTVDGNWRRTAQNEDFWGEERLEGFGSFTIRYRERDEDAVRGMIAILGPRTLQIARDLGTSTVPVRIWVWPYSPPDENWVGEGPILVAPETHTHPADRTLGEYLADALTDDLALILIARRAGVDDMTDYAHPLLQALARWELRRLGTDIELPEPGREEMRRALEDGTYMPLSALWETSDYNAITYWESEALIATIDEIYGEGGVISLLNFWTRSETMDDWLIESLGISSAGLSESWLNRLRVLVGE